MKHDKLPWQETVRFLKESAELAKDRVPALKVLRGRASRRRAETRIQRLWKEQRGVCFYCEQLVPQPVKSMIPLRGDAMRRMPTVEHVVRLADGGSNAIENCAMACAWCNHMRERASVEEHRRIMKWYVLLGQHPLSPRALVDEVAT